MWPHPFFFCGSDMEVDIMLTSSPLLLFIIHFLTWHSDTWPPMDEPVPTLQCNNIEEYSFFDTIILERRLLCQHSSSDSYGSIDQWFILIHYFSDRSTIHINSEFPSSSHFLSPLYMAKYAYDTWSSHWVTLSYFHGTVLVFTWHCMKSDTWHMM
jgi:hypothetical protein